MIFIQNFYKFFFHYLKFYCKMNYSLRKQFEIDGIDYGTIHIIRY